MDPQLPKSACAPGKIILSGEHAVVYGNPALVTAVTCYAESTCQPGSQPGLSLSLPSTIEKSYTWKEVLSVHDTCTERYEAFLAHERPIENVVENEADFAAYAAGLLIKTFFLRPKEGIDLKVSSAIPRGCGMGSSAAVAATVFKALADQLGLELDRDRFAEYTMATEKLQHGRPSGVDPYAVVHGGCVRFQGGKATPVAIPDLSHFTFMHTGTPSSTTGEAVMQVAKHHEDSSIWTEFEAVTEAMEKAFVEPSSMELAGLVRENHQLLVRIGVVPQKIQDVVQSIEARGGAAKLCGAGAIRGDQGGMLMVIDENPGAVMNEYNYKAYTLSCDTKGLHQKPIE